MSTTEFVTIYRYEALVILSLQKETTAWEQREYLQSFNKKIDSEFSLSPTNGEQININNILGSSKLGKKSGWVENFYKTKKLIFAWEENKNGEATYLIQLNEKEKEQREKIRTILKLNKAFFDGDFQSGILKSQIKKFVDAHQDIILNKEEFDFFRLASESINYDRFFYDDFYNKDQQKPIPHIIQHLEGAVDDISDSIQKGLLSKNIKYNSIIFDKFKIETKKLLNAKATTIFKNTELFVIDSDLPFNKIYSGPPGVGKSHLIDSMLKNNNIENDFIFRTAFHSDYSFSDFFGQHKPISIDGKPQYNFVPGIFIQAYIKAHKNPMENVVLVLEEINRGIPNSIFGDIFQLLDRDDSGNSKYPIKTPNDAMIYLDSFGVPNPSQLSIPKNLKLLATMNTSDQSVYSLDSAFKRRWDFEYVEINYSEPTLQNILIENTDIKWLDFLEKINTIILNTFENDDKQLGQWFLKPKKGQISEQDFKNKVLSYLFFDVFKHEKTVIFDDTSFSLVRQKNIKNTLEKIMNLN